MIHWVSLAFSISNVSRHSTGARRDGCRGALRGGGLGDRGLLQRRVGANAPHRALEADLVRHLGQVVEAGLHTLLQLLQLRFPPMAFWRTEL